MTLTLSSTALALSIANRIGQTQHSLDTVSERLSSGLRLGREDAADLSLAEKLKVDARVFAQGVRNVNEGISLANTTEVSLRELEAITLRQIELAQQAANGATSATQRRALDAEANALVDEFNRLVESTQYNGINTLREDAQDVYISPAAGTEGELIQIETNEELQRTIGDGTFTNSGTYGFTAGGVYPQMVSGDFNGDGRDDLIGIDTSGDQYSIMFGQADGSFSAPTADVLLDPGVSSITSGDVDSDGDLDFLVSVAGDELGIYLNDGSGNFTDSFQVVESDFDNLRASDINGDGAIDIVSTVTADFVTEETFSSGGAEVSELSIGSTGGGGQPEITELTFDSGTAGAGQPEITRVDFNAGSTFVSGDILTLFSANDGDEYEFVYEVDGMPSALNPPPIISVVISISSSDTAVQVRDKTITAVTGTGDFSLDSSGSGFAVFETAANGTATDASISQSGTGLSVTVN